MDYANIISLIDAHLKRLLQVRSILAELNLPLSQGNVVTLIPNRTAQSGSAKKDISHRKTSKFIVRKPYTKRKSVAPAEDRSASPPAISGFQSDAIPPSKPTTQAIEKIVSLGSIPAARSRRSQPPKKKLVAQKPPAKSGPLALGGKIPTGPVVVPAERIRYEQSLRQREAAIKAPSDLPLTAEILAQRWIQGANDYVTKN